MQGKPSDCEVRVSQGSSYRKSTVCHWRPSLKGSKGQGFFRFALNGTPINSDTQVTLQLQVLFGDVVSVPLARANDVSYCVKKTTYHNVVLKGGLEAGNYMPWEPGDVSHMTVDKCTEHCCQSPDTDVVFLLNR